MTGIGTAVSDTSPLHYLVLIGAIDLLPKLFAQVFIANPVRAELMHRETPATVRAWMKAPPAWLTVQPHPADDGADLQILDEGERATIAQGGLLHSSLILMDERAGVAIARARGLAVTGTLGLLDRAAKEGLTDLATAFAALQSTSFHVRSGLLDAVPAQDRERRHKA